MKYTVTIDTDNSLKKVEKLFIALKDLGAIDGIIEIEEIKDPVPETPTPEVVNGLVFSLKDTMETLYEYYPKKQGKAKGIEYMSAYLTKGRVVKGFGRLTYNAHQLSLAIRQYAFECEDKDEQYIQMFSTFMNKSVIDYVEKTKEKYENGMQKKYGDDWENKKFIYK